MNADKNSQPYDSKKMNVAELKQEISKLEISLLGRACSDIALSKEEIGKIKRRVQYLRNQYQKVTGHNYTF